MKPGDWVSTTCTYNTEARAGTTAFGQATSDEMCIGFILYYPRATAYKKQQTDLAHYGSPGTLTQSAVAMMDKGSDLAWGRAEYVYSARRGTTTTPLGPPYDKATWAATKEGLAIEAYAAESDNCSSIDTFYARPDVITDQVTLLPLSVRVYCTAYSL